MCHQTIVGVALKRRRPLESLVHGNRACQGSGEGGWKRAGLCQYLAGRLSYSGDGRKRVARRAARPVGMVKGAFLESQLPVAQWNANRSTLEAVPPSISVVQ